MSAIFLSRNARLLVEFGSGGSKFEIPILEGFSFSQSMNTAEVTLSEATRSGVSRRGRKLFNNSLAPVEFSFQTYVRPFKGAGDSSNTGHMHDTSGMGLAVEAPLWAMFAGADTYDGASDLKPFDRTGDNAGDVITSTQNSDNSTATTMTVDFDKSDVPQLKTDVSLIFEIEEEDGAGVLTYTIAEAVLNECTIDFDIEGIATLSWSGMGKSITEGSSAIVADVDEGTGIGAAKAAPFIQNRLSTVTIAHAAGHDNFLTAYNLTLTGGSITMTNNITYLTPEEIGRVNSPIGHVTGTRNVTGTLTCYLDNATAGSADLFEDISLTTTDITNTFDLGINVGGTTGPAVTFNVDQANLQIPTHSFDDVVSVEVTFDGLPSTMSAANEVQVVYKNSGTKLAAKGS